MRSSGDRTRAPLTKLVSVRLSERETDEIQEAAKRAGMSVSRFIRQAALREARPALWADLSRTIHVSGTMSDG